jgi:dTDP-4-amino-4,6-dideoxygalactose transaminase
VNRDRDAALLSPDQETIPLFWPHITDAMRARVAAQLQTRWLGQGPSVEEFEQRFQTHVTGDSTFAVAVNSGTSALHLSYLLAMNKFWPGWKPSDGGEAIVPVFTCTATNIPFLYMGLKLRWADIDPISMNVSIESIESAINEKTRAIVVVHYGGYVVDVPAVQQLASKHGIPVIEDAAQALGGHLNGQQVGQLGDYSAFSFQAIKHITTGDGGLLTVRDNDDLLKARRLRWFGIDRAGKQNGTWENDIWEMGYKYQMTDIAASMGLAGLDDLDSVLTHRRTLLQRYADNLKNENRVHLLVPERSSIADSGHAAWLATIIVEENRDLLRDKLRDNKIEANPVHFRNDMYTLFQNSAYGDCPIMDSIDAKYLCLPLHTNIGISEVDRVCEVIVSKW